MAGQRNETNIWSIIQFTYLEYYPIHAKNGSLKGALRRRVTSHTSRQGERCVNRAERTGVEHRSHEDRGATEEREMAIEREVESAKLGTMFTSRTARSRKATPTQ